MRILESNNFILTQSIIDPNGDSTWTVREKKHFNRIFYIHVFSKNQLNIKLYHHIKNADEAISLLCDTLQVENDIAPRINIHYTNKALITVCCKAGFRKKKNIKHLYIYKKRD